jgi:sulfatase modifying factor 1
MLHIKTILITILLCSIIHSQTSFQNINVIQSEDTVKISYDLWGGYDQESYLIEMDVSNDGGSNFRILPRLAQGDIGYGIKRGYGKRIWWEPLKEGIELVGDNFKFRLKLSVPGSSPSIEFVKVTGGTFKIGDEFEEGDYDERMILPITLDDFEISKFEITNAQYSAFLESYGSDEVKSGEYQGEKLIYENDKGLKYLQGKWSPAIGYDNFPVVCVTWYGAIEFCNYYHYRLPTEAEWEYAAREEGKEIKFGNGKNIPNLKEINYNPNESQTSIDRSANNLNIGSQQSVGAYAPNILGLFQMSGNVWEWCLDWYAFNYDSTKTKNPTGPWLGRYKVLRGGSFDNNSKAVRTTERTFLSPHRFSMDVGFRVARSIHSRESIEENKTNE